MRTINVLMATLLLQGTVYAQPPDATTVEDAEMMTTIEFRNTDEWQTVKRRFIFLLGRFDVICPADDGQMATDSNLLAFYYGKLREAGLHREESLLALSNNLHRLTTTLQAVLAEHGSPPMECDDLWAQYVALRLEYHPPATIIEYFARFFESMFEEMDSLSDTPGD